MFRIIFGILALLTFYCFYSWVEVGTYFNRGSTLVTLTGAVLTSFFLVLTIGNFKSGLDIFNADDDYEQGVRHGLWPLSFIFMLIIGYFFLTSYESRKDNELINFGIRTKAKILDGLEQTSSSIKRTTTSHQLTFEYVIQDGQKIKWTNSVSSEEFGNAYKGQNIEIIYSSKNPRIVAFLTNKQARAKFLKLAEHPIEISNFEKICTLTNQDTIINYLNSFNYGWSSLSVKGENNIMLSNEESEAILIKPEMNKVVLVEPQSMKSEKLEKDLNNLGFVKTDLPKEGNVISNTLFKKDNISIVKKTSMGSPFESDNENHSTGIRVSEITIFTKN